MSNKSRGPQKRQPTLTDFSRRLAEAAAKAREQQQTSQDEETETENDGPQGTLPLPTGQSVSDTVYQWVWEPILDTIIIKATLLLARLTVSLRVCSRYRVKLPMTRSPARLDLTRTTKSSA